MAKITRTHRLPPPRVHHSRCEARLLEAGFGGGFAAASEIPSSWQKSRIDA